MSRSSNTTDPRILKSQTAIRDAFVRLLESKDFHDLSTREIIAEADINRNTFYKHYRSKNDLALRLAEQLKTEFHRVITEFFRRDFHRHDQEADRVLFEQRRLMLALWNVHTRRCHLYQDMLDIAAQGFLQHMHGHYPQAVRNRDYQARMFSGLVLATTSYYFRQDQPLPTAAALLELKELTAILCREALPPSANQA